MSAKSAKKKKPSYDVVIPANVRFDNSLVPNAKLLYGEITALCKKDGCCRASNIYFAGLYDVKRSSVSNWIRALVDAGYLDVEYLSVDGKPNIKNMKIFLKDQAARKKRRIK